MKNSPANVARLARAAKKGGRHIGVVESLTCGAIAATIGTGDNAADWFRGGIVAYQTGVKERLLGLPIGMDPATAEAAEQLASSGRRVLDADVVVAVTGVGGPDERDGHPPGTVYLAWASRSGTAHVHLQFDGDPAEVIRSSTDAAIDRLVELLEG